MQALNYSVFFFCPDLSGSLQKDPNRGSENFYLKKTLCRNLKSERKGLIVGLGRARPHKNFCLQNRLLKGKHGITCLRFYLLGFQGWAVCLPETFSIGTTWNKVITKYGSTEMSQGPSSTQLSIKENWREGDRGPDSHPCVERSVKKAAVAFETDLRKGRQ